MALDTSPPNSDRIPLPSTLLHDLRTPLNHILGYSEMLLEQAEDTENASLLPDLKKITTAGQNLLALLNASFVSSASETNAVTFEAPIRQPFVQKSVKEPKGELASGVAAGYILVVDDDEGNRDVLSQRLENQGYSVDTAENGERALEMLRDDNFDLVLLDLLMPGTDGFEVLQRIKSDDQIKHVPVIMISALDELGSVARCIEMGAEDYLPKPFNPVLLKARIGATLERKRARDSETHLFHELQKNYKLLEELQTARDNLAHMIIHDLRTPLTSVIAGMQTLDVVGDINPEQRSVMDIAISGGETLLGMINDLLDVDKAEAGSLQLEYGAVSVPELVRSAVGQVASLAEVAQLDLVHVTPSDLPSLSADESKLRRTLVNLLGNAIKFTPAGGTVTIEATYDALRQTMDFCVSDSGEGIPQEAFERIFEKFGQVESRSAGRVFSTGLGLTFCKMAVEAHGGHIEVQSAPAKGSIFCFDIPLLAAKKEFGQGQLGDHQASVTPL